ncbi:hypothetical protein ACH49O_09505 [Streptomyces coeruleorubidus]|uniref:hypothetical protein n=1 Tax=Streptomyces coeruleorubidus TaxID=116188 RepID=UPI0033ED2657
MDRSDNLPAYVIAKAGDLRVVSGFRALGFWRCDIRALYPCPDGMRRYGRFHATPKPRDVLFDDLVRQTAAGTIVRSGLWPGAPRSPSPGVPPQRHDCPQRGCCGQSGYLRRRRT